MGSRSRWTSIAVTLVALAGGSCTSGDDPPASGPPETTGDAAPSGPAPGVSQDAIGVGVTYVDTEALAAIGLNYDLGDYEGSYRALFDQINADGGIHGRRIEPVFAPVDPTTADPGAQECVELTEDEDVFLVMGFFLTDSVLCPVATHATAVIGGEINAERAAQAQAPWASSAPDADLTAAVVRAFADRQLLDGSVAVFASAIDQATVDNQVMPVLDELGIEPVEVGVFDAPAGDLVAAEAQIRPIGERFQASGADTVLIVGQSGQGWPTTFESDASYRPQLLFTDDLGMTAFATNAATVDTSILDGALAGGDFGPDEARFEETSMQDCIATIEAAGIEVPSPDEVGADPSNQPFQGPFFACSDVALMKAWFEAAGEDLNYGSLEAALNGLSVHLPGDPTLRTYGPVPAADGDPTAYIVAWDAEQGRLVLDE